MSYIMKNCMPLSFFNKKKIFNNNFDYEKKIQKKPDFF